MAAAFKRMIRSLEDSANSDKNDSWYGKLYDLQRPVTEVHLMKFTECKVKGDLGFGYNYW